MGGYAATVLTAVTAQNTVGVHSVHHLPIELVEAQIQAIVSDMSVAAVKTGFLGRSETVRLIADQTPGSKGYGALGAGAGRRDDEI